MKWFKHFSDANNNATLILMREELGWGFVERYWILCELIAQRMNSTNNWQPILEITEKQLKTNLGLKQNKLSSFLVYCEKQLRINLTRVDNKLIIKYDKMLELKDNTSQDFQARDKRLPCQEKEKEKEKDKEKELKEIYKEKNLFDIIAQFNAVWQKYPNKDGKKEAFRHFKTSVKSEEDFEQIKKALANYLSSQTVKDGYIKNGSTWFNNWKDWVDYKGVENGSGKFSTGGRGTKKEKYDPDKVDWKNEPNTL